MFADISWACRRAIRGVAPFAAPKLTRLAQHSPKQLRLPKHRPKPTGICPTFSIVTPSYQHATFIGRTIQSISSQGYPEVEHIIIDGNSTDGTKEILRQYDRYLDRKSTRLNSS